MLPGRPSSFLDAIPEEMVEKRSSIKVRSSGRAVMRAGGSGGGGRYGAYGNYGRPGRPDSGADADFWANRPSAAARRPGRPLEFDGAPAFEDESQDAPVFQIGIRVKHRKFGSGTVAELNGVGRSAKVKVDFDDETIGRKTLVIAQANLERGDD
jgi:DNA helicase-2/ATP-dependent DNA helicase PcrA